MYNDNKHVQNKSHFELCGGRNGKSSATVPKCLSVRLWASGYPRGICSSVTRSGNRLSVVGVACPEFGESFLGGHKMMSGPYHYYYYLS